jgi:hypothetical protein
MASVAAFNDASRHLIWAEGPIDIIVQLSRLGLNVNASEHEPGFIPNV